MNATLFSTKRISRILTAIVLSCMLGSCSVIRVVEVDSPTWDCAGSGQKFCHDTLIKTSVWKGRNNKINLKKPMPEWHQQG